MVSHLIKKQDRSQWLRDSRSQMERLVRAGELDLANGIIAKVRELGFVEEAGLLEVFAKYAKV